MLAFAFARARSRGEKNDVSIDSDLNNKGWKSFAVATHPLATS